MTPTEIAEAERLVREWKPDPASCEIETAPESALGQNRSFAERRPNGRFPIRKRPLRVAPRNDRFWPIPAVGTRASRMTAGGQLPTIPDRLKVGRTRG